ncbi:hypothetical protein [Actinomycetospora sp. TBRC 11914]|uniref:hypothetical protein n=1 Tax=Actinomycetospora sp. TBRC 11914 TaxID=2729387 RepID=UPI00145CDE93|nr:hypothetical protein [Actinomycetospora sp. TBRC 11914]NMO93217.1 hypothetical protein [Actinomycetospora sp. TBRC 11914]
MPLPGDPEAIEEACRGLAAAATAVETGGEAVAGHGRATTADWTGLAAPLALARTQQDARNAQRVAEAVRAAVGPLARYAEELRAAQQDYARGEALLAQGQAATSALGSGQDPTLDGGGALMRAAEERARFANEAAARALDAASSSLAGIAPPPTPPAAATTSPLAEVGNAVASVGMAALDHPLDLAAVVGGGALAAVSGAVAAGSVALDATGVGLIAGLPVGGAAAAGVAAGVGIAGAGLVDLATHAATDSSVAPFQVDQETDASRIDERARTVGKPGKNKRVRVVETEEEVRALYDELSEGGTPAEWPDYGGRVVEFPDGTRVGLRDSSSSAPGSSVDVRIPGQPPRKVHREGQ